jgi:hypothetical protein
MTSCNLVKLLSLNLMLTKIEIMTMPEVHKIFCVGRSNS